MSEDNRSGADHAASAKDPDTDAAPIDHAERLAQFVERFENLRITYTAAAIVTYAGDLYNVDESTDDPYIDGLNWKQLLIPVEPRA